MRAFEEYWLVVGEIQLHYRPILELKENEMHLFYEIERAAAIAELIPKGEASAPGASSGQRVSVLEAKLAEEKTEKDAVLAALAEKDAVLAEKEAELASLREMIAERQRWRAQSPKAGAVRDPTGTAKTPR